MRGLMIPQRLGTIVVSLFLASSPSSGFHPVTKWRTLGPLSLTNFPFESKEDEADAASPVNVEVSFEGRSCNVAVNANETILAAMERNSVMDELCLPNLPADCRRGNCMTCTGLLLSGKVNHGDDGLSPHVSNLFQSSDLVLTCCSHAVSDGTRIELGVNDKAWTDFQQSRFLSEEAIQMNREAVARLMRLNAEENVPRWKDKTEAVLQSTDDEQDTVIGGL